MLVNSQFKAMSGIRRSIGLNIYDFDPADMLKSKHARAVFLADTLETNDERHIASALTTVDRAKNKFQNDRQTDFAKGHLPKLR